MGPHIKTKTLPGPKARKVINRDKKTMSTSNAHAYPFVFSHGKGNNVWDVDGNRFLDLAAGIATSSTGYNNPKVIKAIKKQSDQFLSMCSAVFYNEIQVDVGERICKLAQIKGNGKNRIFFGNSGAEVWEGAMKLARYRTGRKAIIAFYGGFHGRTYGGIGATATKIYYRKGFGPMLGELYHAFYPRPYKCPADAEYPTTTKGCLDYIEKTLFEKIIHPSEVAAIAFEPIQGEGGYIVPSKEFIQGLRRICDKHGILMIADEVQSGMGRTGKLFAMEHFDVKPDIICTAKGIASGMPLAAFIANEKVMNWPEGVHGSTFGGNAVSLAAAGATLDLLEGKLMKNATTVGDYILNRIAGWVDTYDCIGDTRGLGLMIGIEIVKNKAKAPQPEKKLRDQIIQKCFKSGLLALGCGNNSIRLSPPLTLTKTEAKGALDIIEGFLK